MTLSEFKIWLDGIISAKEVAGDNVSARLLDVIKKKLDSVEPDVKREIAIPSTPESIPGIGIPYIPQDNPYIPNPNWPFPTITMYGCPSTVWKEIGAHTVLYNTNGSQG